VSKLEKDLAASDKAFGNKIKILEDNLKKAYGSGGGTTKCESSTTASIFMASINSTPQEKLVKPKRIKDHVSSFFKATVAPNV
jgi:hypothetical protein